MSGSLHNGGSVEPGLDLFRATAYFANGTAQARLPRSEIREWFAELGAAEKAIAYRAIAFITFEARPVAAEVALARSLTTLAPEELGHFDEFGEFEPIRLRVEEQDLIERGFRFLTCLFSIADARRRVTQCADGCEHPWHRGAPSTARAYSVIDG